MGSLAWLRRWAEISWGTAKVLKHLVDKAPSSSLLAATAVLSACLSILAVITHTLNKEQSLI